MRRTQGLAAVVGLVMVVVALGFEVGAADRDSVSPLLYVWGTVKPINLTAVGQQLAAQLTPDKGFAEQTLEVSSAYTHLLVAVNISIPCHWHPTTASMTVLSGRYFFHVPYQAERVELGPGDRYVTPATSRHAEGAIVTNPNDVTVFLLRWTPAAGPNNTIYVDPKQCVYQEDSSK
eukprot:m.488885 g.488885  ORF g.488885 m.488885 type:complete len:176 (+) comp26184_c0_seq1:94-621(+)